MAREKTNLKMDKNLSLLSLRVLFSLFVFAVTSAPTFACVHNEYKTKMWKEKATCLSNEWPAGRRFSRRWCRNVQVC